MYNVSERSRGGNSVEEHSEVWEDQHNDWRNSKGVLGDTTTVRFTFYDFGGKPDSQRATNFAVDVEWPDVIAVITRFADHGHRIARVLRAVLDALG